MFPIVRYSISHTLDFRQKVFELDIVNERFSYVSSICACLVLSVSFSSWCLGRAAVCDCGTPWTFLLPVFL